MKTAPENRRSSWLAPRCDEEEGFTLVELLVVILIIGVLAAIAIPAFLNQRKEAQVAALKSDLKNTATQIATLEIGGNPSGMTFKSKVSASGSIASGANPTIAAVNILAAGGDSDAFTLSPGITVSQSYFGQGNFCLHGQAEGTEFSGSNFLMYDSRAGGIITTEQLADAENRACGTLPPADSEGDSTGTTETATPFVGSYSMNMATMGPKSTATEYEYQNYNLLVFDTSNASDADKAALTNGDVSTTAGNITLDNGFGTAIGLENSSADMLDAPEFAFRGHLADEDITVIRVFTSSMFPSTAMEEAATNSGGIVSQSATYTYTDAAGNEVSAPFVWSFDHQP